MISFKLLDKTLYAYVKAMDNDLIKSPCLIDGYKPIYDAIYDLIAVIEDYYGEEKEEEIDVNKI